MIIEHLGKKPDIHPSAYVAPNATICGDVEIGMGARILFGAQIISISPSLCMGSSDHLN